jgi:hypothetical protein
MVERKGNMQDSIYLDLLELEDWTTLAQSVCGGDLSGSASTDSTTGAVDQQSLTASGINLSIDDKLGLGLRRPKFPPIPPKFTFGSNPTT